jgi:hypothetical protein
MKEVIERLSKLSGDLRLWKTVSRIFVLFSKDKEKMGIWADLENEINVLVESGEIVLPKETRSLLKYWDEVKITVKNEETRERVEQLVKLCIIYYGRTICLAAE